MEDIQVVRSASCRSLSGGSTINYEIGSKGENRYIRISSNSAGGFYCRDWIPLADIQAILAGSAKLTSKTLLPLYVGKSANSPGFLLAALNHEKITETAPATPEIPKPAKEKKSKTTGPEE
jgi:hypothetical protein